MSVNHYINAYPQSAPATVVGLQGVFWLTSAEYECQNYTITKTAFKLLGFKVQYQ